MINSKLNILNCTKNPLISRINHRKHVRKITKNIIENQMSCRNKSWNQRVSRKLQLCSSIARSKQIWIYFKNNKHQSANIKQNLKNLILICRNSKKKIVISMHYSRNSCRRQHRLSNKEIHVCLKLRALSRSTEQVKWKSILYMILC